MDDAFLARLKTLPTGYSEGGFEGRRYGVTLSVSADGRRRWLYAEELGGPDRISCNIYLLDGARVALKPCEMPAEKIVRFVLGLEDRRPDTAHARRAMR